MIEFYRVTFKGRISAEIKNFIAREAIWPLKQPKTALIPVPLYFDFAAKFRNANDSLKQKTGIVSEKAVMTTEDWQVVAGVFNIIDCYKYSSCEDVEEVFKNSNGIIKTWHENGRIRTHEEGIDRESFIQRNYHPYHCHVSKVKTNWDKNGELVWENNDINTPAAAGITINRNVSDAYDRESFKRNDDNVFELRSDNGYPHEFIINIKRQNSVKVTVAVTVEGVSGKTRTYYPVPDHKNIRFKTNCY